MRHPSDLRHALLYKRYLTLLKIPPRKLHLLFVDGNIGSVARYEKHERGSVVAMYEALRFLIPGNIPRLDSVTLDRIFEICGKHEIEANRTRKMRKEHYVYLDLSKSNSSVSGITEFLDALEKNIFPEGEGPALFFGETGRLQDSDGFVLEAGDIAITQETLTAVKSKLLMKSNRELAEFIFLHKEPSNQRSGNEIKFFYMSAAPGDLENWVNKFLRKYEEKSATVQGDELLREMIICIRALMIYLHPYPDFNNRTIVNIVLNEMLLSKGYHPAIFEDPNIFEFFSIEELLDKLKVALDNSEKLLRGEEDLFLTPIESENRYLEESLFSSTYPLFSWHLQESFINYISRELPQYSTEIAYLYDGLLRSDIDYTRLNSLPDFLVQDLSLLYNAEGHNLTMLAIRDDQPSALELLLKSHPEERTAHVTLCSHTGASVSSFLTFYDNQASRMLENDKENTTYTPGLFSKKRMREEHGIAILSQPKKPCYLLSSI